MSLLSNYLRDLQLFCSFQEVIRLVGRRLNPSGAGRSKSETQMLDIQGRTPAVPVPPPCSDVQFYSLELTPLPDGQLHVGFTATLVDEVELEFVNQQIASDRVASIEDVVALIRQHVRPGSSAATSAQSS